jgi:hypothetical protein
MGRIHRVGQTRDVELYNLVATGTREGQVLEVLLTNFVVAANQLDPPGLARRQEIEDLLVRNGRKTTVTSPQR